MPGNFNINVCLQLWKVPWLLFGDKKNDWLIEPWCHFSSDSSDVCEALQQSTRSATNNYYHFRLFCWLFPQLNHFVVWSIKYKLWEMFPKAPNIQFTVINEEINQKMFTFKKLASEKSVWKKKMTQTDSSVTKIVADQSNSWQLINLSL